MVLPDGAAQMGWMWSKGHCERQVAFEHRRYPTDLTDEEWARVGLFLPARVKRGRPPSTDLRELLNAIRCLMRAAA